MIARITTKTKEYLACPECGSAAHGWGHLKLGESFGPWYCDDCGLGIRGDATADGAHIEASYDRKIKTLVLLRLCEALKGGEEVHVVVEGMKFAKEGDSPNFENDEYFYNEHQCPWNYLGLPLKAGDDTDPHGIFVHQETVLAPEVYDIHEVFDDADKWRELFPSLRSDQSVVSEVPAADGDGLDRLIAHLKYVEGPK